MIQNILLERYRSYDSARFEFDSSVNVVVGPNAAGKTNLLEALLVACRGKSYRAKDTDLIMFGCEQARITLNNTDRKIDVLLGRQLPHKLFVIDSETRYKRLPAHIKTPVVLFEPNHLGVLNGSPESRRNFLDELGQQLIPVFPKVSRDYVKTLRQRNALLKKAGPMIKEQIFPWDLELSRLAGQLVEMRLELIETINQRLNSAYAAFAGEGYDIEAVYNSKISSGNYESRMLEELKASMVMDIATGHTAVGPHRDDFKVYFNKHSSELTASRGEVRTAVLALKTIEADLITERYGYRPVFLLDDVFSELDSIRRSQLLESLSMDQTFITTTDADIVKQRSMGKVKLIRLPG